MHIRCSREPLLRFGYRLQPQNFRSSILLLSKIWQDGFAAFVKGIVGILSWENDSKAGINPSRNNHYFLIPNWGLYEVVDLLCRCQSIWGRVTHVYHLRKVDEAKKIFDDRLSNVIDLTIDISTARYPTSTSRPRTEGIVPSSN
ncbi:hypothetical protein SERLA73DRAFT_80757 [Serpula lacrymans var. lacrymans S7.3]|uniref:Uncharacterized protein n=1 Tax=Serpula lacrymans var. lacrymans (strain S7.3) TaxID=936435 RepID=F8QK81_SERL3|nr:hypothetical protein SERLA73DRAFT_80757 [Serpula lacrymans var. lacrymans S7.3]